MEKPAASTEFALQSPGRLQPPGRAASPPPPPPPPPLRVESLPPPYSSPTATHSGLKLSATAAALDNTSAFTGPPAMTQPAAWDDEGGYVRSATTDTLVLANASPLANASAPPPSTPPRQIVAALALTQQQQTNQQKPPPPPPPPPPLGRRGILVWSVVDYLIGCAFLAVAIGIHADGGYSSRYRESRSYFNHASYINSYYVYRYSPAEMAIIIICYVFGPMWMIRSLSIFLGTATKQLGFFRLARLFLWIHIISCFPISVPWYMILYKSIKAEQEGIAAKRSQAGIAAKRSLEVIAAAKRSQAGRATPEVLG